MRRAGWKCLDGRVKTLETFWRGRRALWQKRIRSTKTHDVKKQKDNDEECERRVAADAEVGVAGEAMQGQPSQEEMEEGSNHDEKPYW